MFLKMERMDKKWDGFVGGCAVSAVVLFLLVVLIRTILFVPKSTPEAETDKIVVDREKIVSDMVAMIPL